jgi:hypothetical protein
MSRLRKLRKGKKAFISDAVVDIWALFMFVLVIIFFAIFYKWTAEAKMQQIQDKRDIADGNYLAQVYLRTPISVGGTEMTISELISFCDYNQSMEAKQDKSYAEWIQEKTSFSLGKKTDLCGSLEKMTKEFVEQNFDSNRCFTFAIKGNAYEYSYKSFSCPGSSAFSMYYLVKQVLNNVPTAAYATYLASIDPRENPIIVISIYDFERLLAIYAPDPYFDMNDAQRAATALACSAPPGALAPQCLKMTTKGYGITE